MSGILEKLEEELGSRNVRRLKLRSSTCERDIDVIKTKGELTVFIPGDRKVTREAWKQEKGSSE